MLKKPLFITFEGGDGSGKSTQACRFHKWFLANYGAAVLTREPGGVGVSEQIRYVLLNRDNQMSSLAELFLFEAARTEFARKIVVPTIDRGESVISDRFYDSTTAYQGYARELDLQLVQQMNNTAVTFNGKAYHPDLTFIIDVNPAVGLANAKSRGALNRIDSEALKFHYNVREGFLKIAKSEPERCIIIPYQEGIEKVRQAIVNEFLARYK